MNEIKNALETIANRADQMEERLCELKDKDLEMIQMEEKKELRFELRFKKVTKPYKNSQIPSEEPG